MSIEEPDIGEVQVNFYPTARTRTAHYVALDLVADLRYCTPEQVDSCAGLRATRPVLGLILLHEFDSSVSTPVGSRLVWAVHDELSGQVVEVDDLTTDNAWFVGIAEGDELPPDEDFAEAVGALRRTLKRRIRSLEQRQAERRAAA